jgi:hypothetical protein
MNIKALPCDIKTLKVVTRRANGRIYASVNIPTDVVRRYDLKRGDHIVIAYICKGGEDCQVKND